MSSISDGDRRPLRVLTLLCQKICATGSGVVVKEMVDNAAAAGVEYAVLSGGYASDDPAQLLRQRPAELRQVQFESAPPEGIAMPIAGMSNRMPYPSVAWKDLSDRELDAYAATWTLHVERLIESFRPEVVHVHHLWLLASIAACVAGPVPIVISVHGTDLQRADDAPRVKQRVTPCARRFERFLVLTGEGMKRTRERYEVDDDRFAIVGNGFNENLFRVHREGDVYAMYAIPRGRRVVLFVGKYERWKGIEWLIRAFARLRREDDPLLVIAGGGPDGERARYDAIAASCGVAKDVIFTGVVPYEHVGLLMNAAELLALPAFEEPFGLVVLEALACGLRVVTTDQSGPPSFIPHELRERGDALLLEGLPSVEPSAGDAERFVADLASAITFHLDRPRRSNEREEISAAVRHLTWRAYMATLGNVYRQVLGAR